jgi:flagellar L-ring protein FlgH
MKASTLALSIIALVSWVIPSSATSLWEEADKNGRAVSLFSDRVAANKGDLVTIVVNQSTTAKRDQSTETEKSVSVNDQLSAFIGPFMGGIRGGDELLRRNPHSAWSSERSFDGNGKVENTENLTSTIQARVTDVLPNKVLRIEASRRVSAGDETSYMILSGFVRSEDVTSANSVLSTQVADLQVKQVGQGAISREQRKGWLTRIWETISPF